jgi:hypothetical protein
MGRQGGGGAELRWDAIGWGEGRAHLGAQVWGRGGPTFGRQGGGWNGPTFGHEVGERGGRFSAHVRAPLINTCSIQYKILTIFNKAKL